MVSTSSAFRSVCLNMSLQDLEVQNFLMPQDYMIVLMRDAEGRKREASKVNQTNKQGKATQHTQDSHFS